MADPTAFFQLHMATDIAKLISEDKMLEIFCFQNTIFKAI
jgi:hypothetical protein